MKRLSRASLYADESGRCFKGVPRKDRVDRTSALEVLLSHDARHI